jgi:hypothetical protein
MACYRDSFTFSLFYNNNNNNNNNNSLNNRKKSSLSWKLCVVAQTGTAEPLYQTSATSLMFRHRPCSYVRVQQNAAWNPQ